MSFAGVSVIADGKLVGTYTSPITAGASGYHLLVIEGHSRTAGPDPVWSRCFTIGGRCWRIAYIPESSLPDYAGFTSLLLCLCESTENEPVKTEFKFSFIDDTDSQERCSRILNFSGYFSQGDREFIRRDALEKSKHLKDDSFTIRCDVAVIDPACNSAPVINVPPSEMRQNLTDLLMAGEGTDVVFQVAGETFRAHRCILAARSAVFKAALFGSMKEGSVNTVVQIDDMDPTVFKALLGFIYGDTLPAPVEGEEEQGIVQLQRLLVAADRYGLRRLRAMCEKRLCEDIGVGTATAIPALAEQHHCDGLKAACYDFLRCPANMKAVVATEGFDHLCRSCPPVMKDLILGILQGRLPSR